MDEFLAVYQRVDFYLYSAVLEINDERDMPPEFLPFLVGRFEGISQEEIEGKILLHHLVFGI